MFSFLVVKILFFLEVVKAKAMMLLYTSGRRDHFKCECGDGKGRPTLLRKVPYSLKRFFFRAYVCVCQLPTQNVRSIFTTTIGTRSLHG